MLFRKFLLGQCQKIIQTKQPFTGFEMCTKNLFDDMYLYLKECYLNALRSDKVKHIDILNGLPRLNENPSKNDHIEVTSHFWNMMHKYP